MPTLTPTKRFGFELLRYEAPPLPRPPVRGGAGFIDKRKPPEFSERADRCRFNTMVDSDECRTGVGIDDVHSGHFTICQKPWICFGSHKHKLCGELHEKWFEVRTDLERAIGLEPTTRGTACSDGKGHTRYGAKNYIKIEIAKAMEAHAGGAYVGVGR